ncbi:MAG: hypothetical protein E6K83_07365 [Thaumarchaeota archaeon]|nr:MAG: hypothetical protein E6K83_07365 [Nitrososphaerota archaeon]
MSFTEITSTLQKELISNMPQIRFLLKKNPGLAFTIINEIAEKVGKRYSVILSLNFPERDKIENYESYGTENIGMVFQRDNKVFAIPRNLIKSKANEILRNAQVQDAYMYEGKEGVRILLENCRLDILPASLHVWGKFDDKITMFCDWLLTNCYQLKPGVNGALSDTNS